MGARGHGIGEMIEVFRISGLDFMFQLIVAEFRFLGSRFRVWVKG